MTTPRPAASDPVPNRPRPSSTAFAAAALLLSAALAIAIGWVDYLPTNDGPQHVFAAYLQGHLHQAGKGWDRYLEHRALVTGSGFVTLLGLLDRVLPWRPAFRIAITAAGLAWAWSVLALAAALGGRRRWLGLLGFATALQWQFYMGLFSCYLATATGFLVLAVAFRDGFDQRNRTLLIAALLTVQAWLHIVPTALTALALLVYAHLSSTASNRLSRLARAVMVCVPAGLLGLVAVVLAGGTDRLAGYGTSASLGDRIVLLGRGFVSGPPWRAWPVTVLALASGLWLLARWRHHDDSRMRALAVAGAGMLALALATPLHIPGWEFFNVRFIPNAIVFGALLVPIPTGPRPRSAAAAALVAFALAAVAWGLAHHLSLRQSHADLWAAAAAPLHRDRARLPLVLEPPPGEPPGEWDRVLPFVNPILHMATLCSIDQGGTPAYLFAGTGAIHALGYRQPPDGIAMPPRPPRGYEWGLWEPAARADSTRRERALAYMLGFAGQYDDVILWGTEADREVLRSRGFAVDFARGGVTIARFVGCPARLHVEPPKSGLPPTLVLAGWWPDSHPTFSTVLASRPSSDALDLVLPDTPCGDVWVRLLFDVDGDGHPSAGDRLCDGADGNAVLRHHVATGAETIVCRAGAPLP